MATDSYDAHDERGQERPHAAHLSERDAEEIVEDHFDGRRRRPHG